MSSAEYWPFCSGLNVSTRHSGLMTFYQNVMFLWRKCIWKCCLQNVHFVPVSVHYNEVIMSAIASQITSLMIVYSSVCLRVDQRKHQSSASLAFVRGIHRRPVTSLHKWPVTRKMFPFDDVIMVSKIMAGTHSGSCEWNPHISFQTLFPHGDIIVTGNTDLWNWSELFAYQLNEIYVEVGVPWRCR